MEEDKKIQEEHSIEKRPCRNCKAEIQTKLRRCPYCGILNPTVTIKEILITMFGVLFVMSIVSYLINN